MKTKCSECDGEIELPENLIVGEIVTCPDCGLDYEVSEVTSDGVSLKKAEDIGEDWGE
ncbi:MAG: lysine biosynthesis protein LysW [Candidatus Methylarchaceae archaeon HK02M2]|nr:lysine biosynthesis protein LysW [Candidatus Methylarchaceae archaeon HK02M2]